MNPMTLGKLFNFFEPYFNHLQNGIKRKNTPEKNFVHTRVQCKYRLSLNSTLSFPAKYVTSFILCT